MERLTEKDSNGNYKIEVKKLEYRCTSGDGKKPRVIRGQHINKLAEYEDLEERLQSVYGECEGLLEKVVEHLERHEDINFQNPVSKARLLTDEEVDRWEELQRYRQSAQSLKGNTERLTSYKSECKREMICRYEDCDTCEEYCPHLNEDNCPCLQEVLEKLSEYEDLEEQGKLLKLPAAVGDKVFQIFLSCPKDYKEEYCEDHEGSCANCHHRVPEIVSSEFRISGTWDMGKIFTTREEAEAALKEMSE